MANVGLALCAAVGWVCRKSPPLVPMIGQKGNLIMKNRREFVLRFVPMAGAALVLPRVALADVPMLTETDPMAKVMGFRLDTTKANQAKYPRHSNDQMCGKCLHFTNPGADSARCDLFNKIVPKGGWCSGFTSRV